MNFLKFLKTVFTSSVFASSAFIVQSNAASAAFLNTTDDVPPFNQLSIGVNFDVSDLDLIRLTPGSGLENPEDLLIPGYGTAGNGPGINFTPNDINVSGTANIGGEAFTVCNTGTTNSGTCEGMITNFIADAFTDYPTFITVTGVAPVSDLDYNFSLDGSSITNPITPTEGIISFTDDALPGGPTSAQCIVDPGQGGCAGLINFFAKGTLTVNGVADGSGFDSEVGQTYPVSYSYSGPRILVNGPTTTSCGTTPGDLCSLNFDLTTGAGNLLVQIEAGETTPEHNSPVALLGLGIISAIGMLNRKKD